MMKREDMAQMKGMFKALMSKMDNFGAELQGVVQRVDNLAGEMQEMREQMQEMRGQMQEVRGEIQEVRGEMQELRTEVSAVEERLNDRLDVIAANMVTKAEFNKLAGTVHMHQEWLFFLDHEARTNSKRIFRMERRVAR